MVVIVSEDWEDCTKVPTWYSVMCVVWCGVVWCVVMVVGLEMLTRSLDVNNWYLQTYPLPPCPHHHTGHTTRHCNGGQRGQTRSLDWAGLESQEVNYQGSKATHWTVSQDRDKSWFVQPEPFRQAAAHQPLGSQDTWWMFCPPRSEWSKLAEKMSFLRPPRPNKWVQIKDLTGLNGLSNYSN